MSLITGTANNVKPPKEWGLGELGDVVRRTEASGEDISTIDELLDFLKSSERDEAYATRLLAAVEAALKQVSRHGLNNQAVVAVESVRPNTIPHAIQNCMTSNFSNVHKKETVMALESYAQYGRWGVCLLLIAVVLKVLDWIINKGGPQKGAVSINDQVDDYISKMNDNLAAASGTNEKVANQMQAIELLKGMKSVTVANSALALKITGGSYPDGVINAAQLLDNLVQENKLESVIDTISALKGGPIFTGLLERVQKRDVSVNEVPREAVRTLLGIGIANTIYAPSVMNSMMEALPPAMIKAGIRLPSSATNARFSRSLNSVSNNTEKLTHCVEELTKLQDRQDKIAINDRDVTTFVADVLTTVEQIDLAVANQAVPMSAGPLRPNDYYPAVGFVSTARAAENLIGYVTDEEVEGHMVYSWITGGCYLSTLSLDQMENDGLLKPDDYKRLMAVFQFMVPDNVDANKGDVSAYKTLLGKFNNLKKKVEVIAKKDGASKSRSPSMDEINDQLTRRVATAGRPGEPQRSRFIASMGQSESVDVIVAIKSVLRLSRDMLKTGAVLQQSIDRHNNSPYVKAEK